MFSATALSMRELFDNGVEGFDEARGQWERVAEKAHEVENTQHQFMQQARIALGLPEQRSLGPKPWPFPMHTRFQD